MNLELSNQVIIFDEAHNMEDASREAASFILKQHEIIKAMQDCEKIKNIGGNEPDALGEIVSEKRVQEGSWIFFVGLFNLHFIIFKRGESRD